MSSKALAWYKARDKRKTPEKLRRRRRSKAQQALQAEVALSSG